MQYSSYQEKINRIVAFLRRLYAFRVLIIISVAIIILLSGTAFVAKGAILSDGACPTEVTYGEELEYKTFAVLAGVKHEYCREGSDEWTEEMPKEIGKYKVRSYARSSLGFKRRGKVQSFEIKPREIAPTIISTEVIYGSEPKVSADLAAGDNIEYELIYDDMASKVANISIDISKIKITDDGGKDKTGNYIINNTLPTAVNILPMPVTVTMGSASKLYDNDVLYNGEYTYTRLAYNDRLVIRGTLPTITNAGSVDNYMTVHILNEDGIEVTGQYDVNMVSGTLTVEKRVVHINIESTQKVYDGLELTGNFSVVNQDAIDFMDEVRHTVRCVSSTKLTDCGTAEAIMTFGVYDSRGNDKTENYSFIIDNVGTITITPRPIKVQTESGSETYNGYGHTFRQLQVIEGSTAGYDVAFISGAKEFINAGTYKNESVAAVYDRMGRDVTFNYTISYEYGDVTINKRDVTISPDVTKIFYTGQIISESTHIAEGLVGGHKSTTTWTLGDKNIGTYVPSFSNTAIYSGEENVTANYNIYYSGTVTVEQKPITITAATNSWVYDDTVHTDTSFTSEGLCQGHTAVVAINGQVRYYKDIAENVISSYIILDENERDVTFNYAVTTVSGKLSITQRPVTVTAGSYFGVYDDMEHRNGEYTVEGLVFGHTLTATVEGSVINAEAVENKVYGAIITRNNADVTENYDISYVSGTLTVSRRPIDITAASQSWVFDNIPHTNSNYTVENASADRGLIGGHSISVTLSGTVQYVTDGNVVNEIAQVTVMSGSRNVTNNYEINRISGTLTVTPRNVAVEILHRDVFYYGKITDVSVDAGAYRFISSVDRLVDGHSLDPNATYIRVNASALGSVNARLVGNVLDADGNDITPNYTFSTTGTVTVIKRPVNLTAMDKTWVYDGKEHSSSEIEVEKESELGGLVSSHTITLPATSGTVINVDQPASNVIVGKPIILNENGENVTDYYNISYGKGTLTVTKRPVTLTSASKTWIYNGSSHSLPEFSANQYIEGGEEIGLVSGHRVTSVLMNSTITDIGSVPNNISEAKISSPAGDVTGNYEISYETGTLTVVGKPITVTTYGGTWLYDGMPHSNSSVSIVSGTQYLPSGYMLECTSITDGGKAENRIVKIFDSRGRNITEEYDISYEEIGILLVYYEITVDTEDESKVYDGTPLVGSKYTLIEGGEYLPEGYKLLFSELTNAGTATNAIIGITDKDGEDISDIYRIESLDNGILTVSKRSITVAAESIEQAYNGIYNSFTNAKTTVGTLAEGHRIEAIDAPTFKNVGTYTNSYKVRILDAAGEDASPNYTISNRDGQVRIIKCVITLQPKTTEHLYTGPGTYSPIKDVELDAVLDGLVANGLTYQITNVSSSRYISSLTADRTYNTSVSTSAFVLTDAEGNRVSSTNYTLVRKNGTMKVVLAKDVTLLIVPSVVTFNGGMHTVTSYVLSSGTLSSGHTLTLNNISLTDAGVITLSDIEKDIFNYIVITNANGEDVSKYYNITLNKNYGENVLEVKAKKLVITSASAERVYDGKTYTNTSFVISQGGPLPTGYTAVVASSTSVDDVGEYKNELRISIYDAGGACHYSDGASNNNFIVEYKYGTITILEPITDQ